MQFFVSLENFGRVDMWGFSNNRFNLFLYFIFYLICYLNIIVRWSHIFFEFCNFFICFLCVPPVGRFFFFIYFLSPSLRCVGLVSIVSWGNPEFWWVTFIVHYSEILRRVVAETYPVIIFIFVLVTSCLLYTSRCV